MMCHTAAECASSLADAETWLGFPLPPPLSRMQKWDTGCEEGLRYIRKPLLKKFTAKDESYNCSSSVQ